MKKFRIEFYVTEVTTSRRKSKVVTYEAKRKLDALLKLFSEFEGLSPFVTLIQETR